MPDEWLWSGRRSQSMVLTISRLCCPRRHSSMQDPWEHSRWPVQHLAHSAWRRKALFRNICCGNVNQACQDPIAPGLYKLSRRSGTPSSFHLIITQSSSHWERYERKLPKKFRVGASHYLTYCTTKSPGLLNSWFSNERLDHSPEAWILPSLRCIPTWTSQSSKALECTAFSYPAPEWTMARSPEVERPVCTDYPRCH